MIDIHCHLLPEVHHGPDSIGQALNTALQASINGVSHVITTPHIHPAEMDACFDTYRTRQLDLQDALDCHHIDLKLGLSVKFVFCPEIIKLVDSQEIPFLGKQGNYQILLLELPPIQIPDGADKLVNALLNRGIRPMLAHPELNQAIINDIEQLKPFIDLGCLIQLNASSLSSSCLDASSACAEQILKNDWATVIASGSFDPTQSSNILARARKAAESIIGEFKAWELVTTNPMNIVREQFESSEVADVIPTPMIEKFQTNAVS